ncbi:MAG: hypothetical protein KC877_03230 [Candidatus Kaiserbacteria bacterium]|nr:hypothetical protein [Candidatus Kaiserbacteria bacterium]MCB9816106.1 hypothetical protein [Candidatus Nomurabacteria bacterium]
MSNNEYRNDVREATREGVWTFWHIFPRFLVAVVVVAAIGFGLRSIGMFGGAVVDRAVFEQTPSYVQGKNTYIARLRLEYETADVGHKEGLRRLIVSEAETIDPSNLTDSNRVFVDSLRR